MTQGGKVHTSLPGYFKNLDNFYFERSLPCSYNSHIILAKQFQINNFPSSTVFLYSSFIVHGPFRNDGYRFHCINNHICHYTTPHKTVIYDSDGMTGDCISYQQEQYNVSQQIFSFFKCWIIEVLHISKSLFFGPLNFKLTRFYWFLIIIKNSEVSWLPEMLYIPDLYSRMTLFNRWRCSGL
jgi:hypothetical protein